jgi:hypothetical protein
MTLESHATVPFAACRGANEGQLGCCGGGAAHLVGVGDGGGDAQRGGPHGCESKARGWG